MVICFSKTITRGSWGTIRTELSPRKPIIRLIRKIRGQKISPFTFVQFVHTDGTEGHRKNAMSGVEKSVQSCYLLVEFFE